MKFAFLFVTAAALSAISIPAAQAQNYPWCAYYNNTGVNCGFQTFAQCQATISGIGGTCEPNTQFQERRYSRHP
jgi:hypothetical protein